MSPSTFAIPDGTTLTQVRDRGGRVFGVDPVTSRTCTYEGDAAGGRLVDSAGELVRQVVPVAAGSAVEAAVKAATKRSKAEPGRRGDRGRWVTLNTFVDRVARHLEAHEIAVWFVVFRWTQDDHAEIRIADIAGRVGKSDRSVQRAVDRLLEVGLLERLKRGTRQGGPSRYRLEPDPSVALPKLSPGTGSQPDTCVTLKRTPKHQQRDRRGAFTTGHE
jgi:DNA-binding transcriptional ArsR family regulator